MSCQGISFTSSNDYIITVNVIDTEPECYEPKNPCRGCIYKEICKNYKE